VPSRSGGEPTSDRPKRAARRWRLYCKEPPRISRDIFVLALAHKEPLSVTVPLQSDYVGADPLSRSAVACKTLLPTERKGSARERKGLLADDRPFPVPATTPEFFPCNDEIIPCLSRRELLR
jgi:hypothetical protein